MVCNEFLVSFMNSNDRQFFRGLDLSVLPTIFRFEILFCVINFVPLARVGKTDNYDFSSDRQMVWLRSFINLETSEASRSCRFVRMIHIINTYVMIFL